ncbi:zeta toxin family protein [Chitinilyticum litopenaei]|uniref:zeta toxin family protein n=1 Tax=Chitinilyticum litopenaei TaxID=1121276 RepID=UPI0003FEBF11|nr:zeta toxin family protein [Chitinilyticum litopenaei]
MSTTPRLRLFAGPNGSGKSTLKNVLNEEWIGVYINPDEIEKGLRANTLIDFSDFGLVVDEDALLDYLRTSTLLAKGGMLESVNNLRFADNRLHFEAVEINSYFASVLADFIRQQLLAQGISFTFESVMSSPDKVEFLRKAQQAGFRTYLYFVATEDPEINVARVSHRVETGGHPVPEDKIRQRYYRSLELLLDAVTYSNRAYIFDNSADDQEHSWGAEVTNGEEIELKSPEMPAWFRKALWDHFEDEPSATDETPLYPAE